ncbi:MAG: hypothetical protein KDB23_15545, partial [Planctomycetales bacterium]|nr:hypothetical protein [Planctomycetales bacterium]
MPPAPSARPNWRGTSAGNQRQPTSRRSERWFLTILSGGLLATLIYVLWLVFFQRPMPTHFVTLRMGEARKLALPSLLTSATDVKPVVELTWPHLHVHDLDALQEGQQIERLGAQLAGFNTGETDALLIYVSAHGIPDLGDADTGIITCRDFDIHQLTANQYSVATLLEALKQSPGRTKLLIFDTGRVGHDGRLGILGNDFPRRVAAALAATEQTEVWALLGNASLQSALIDQADGHSIFGYAVSLALAGAADDPTAGGNDDGYVTLDELYSYVYRECAGTTAGTQTPQLFRSQGATEITPDRVRVTQVLRAAHAPEDAADADPPADATAPAVDQSPPTTAARIRDLWRSPSMVAWQQPASSGPSTGAASSAPTATSNTIPAAAASNDASGETSSATEPAQPPTNDGSPGDTVKTPSQDPTPSAPLPDTPDASTASSLSTSAQLLAEAWELHDRLTHRAMLQASPIEYAPQLWRELERLLLDFQTRAISGANSDLDLQIRKHVEGLQQLELLLNGLRGPINADSTLVVDRLQQATAQYLSSRIRSSAPPGRSLLPELEAAVRQARRSHFRLADWVEWHGQTLMAVNEPDDAFHQISQSLNQALQEAATWRRNAEAWHERPIDSSAAVLLDQQTDFLSRIEQLERLQAARIADALNKPTDAIALRTLLVYVQSPLPGAAERLRLLKTLSQRSTSNMKRAVLLPDWQASHEVTATKLAGLTTQVELEHLLIRLADRDTEFAPIVFDRSNVWQQLRDAGTALRNWYAAAAQELAGTLEPLRSERIAGLLDGRDASLAANLQVGFPQLALRPERVPGAIVLQWESTGPLQMTTQWQSLDLTIKSTFDQSKQVALRFDFDDRLLDL